MKHQNFESSEILVEEGSKVTLDNNLCTLSVCPGPAVVTMVTII